MNQQFPRNIAKSKKYGRIQAKLVPTTTKSNVLNGKGGIPRNKRANRRPKKTIDHKIFERVGEIDLDKNVNYYSCVTWSGSSEQLIAPTHSELINADDYVELKATKDKLNVVAVHLLLQRCLEIMQGLI